ncbi:hypothetical protein TNCV_3813251 [Trichonephila clavipes]|nr:hypothetical protein TNCV_3813251 [Trichonephila clavipes]
MRRCLRRLSARPPKRVGTGGISQLRWAAGVGRDRRTGSPFLYRPNQWSGENENENKIDRERQRAGASAQNEWQRGTEANMRKKPKTGEGRGNKRRQSQPGRDVGGAKHETGRNGQNDKRHGRERTEAGAAKEGNKESEQNKIKISAGLVSGGTCILELARKSEVSDSTNSMIWSLELSSGSKGRLKREHRTIESREVTLADSDRGDRCFGKRQVRDSRRGARNYSMEWPQERSVLKVVV